MASEEQHLINIIVKILGDRASTKEVEKLKGNFQTVSKAADQLSSKVEHLEKKVTSLNNQYDEELKRLTQLATKRKELSQNLHSYVKELFNLEDAQKKLNKVEDDALAKSKELEREKRRELETTIGLLRTRTEFFKVVEEGQKKELNRLDEILKKEEKRTNLEKQRQIAVNELLGSFNRQNVKHLDNLTKEIVLNKKLEQAHKALASSVDRSTGMLSESNRVHEEAIEFDKQRTKTLSGLSQGFEKLAEAQRRTKDQEIFAGFAGLEKNRGVFSFLSRAMKGQNKEVNDLTNRWREFSDGNDRVIRSMARMGHAMLGIVITGVLVFMESFLTALVALVAQAIALASSLGHAAGVLVGAFIPAIAQAIPVVGVLAGVMQRLTLIGQAIEEQDQAQTEASSGLTAQMERQKDAADAVADAQRNLREAQLGLTEARAEARRELQDLVLAERQAELAARGATLSLIESREELRRAVKEGRTEDIERLQLAVDEAKLGKRESRVGLRRAREDRRAPGGRVENTETFINATKRLAEAQRSLARAQRNAAVAAQAETAAQSNLKQALDELTPAERRLMKTIVRIRDRAMEIFQPMSDTIIGSIDRGLRGAERLLSDSKLIKGFTDLSNELARQLDKGFNFLTNRRNVKFFSDTIGEAVKNMRPIGSILRDAFRIFRNIAEGAAPTFRKILKGIAGFFEDIADATSDKKGVSKFFETGLKHLNAWVQFLGAVFDLFIALAGVSEEAGLKTLTTFTETIRGATDGIRENSGPIKEFFESTGPVLSKLGEILVALGKALIDIFDPATFNTFADIVIDVIIPALVLWAKTIGLIIKAIGILMKLPFAKELLTIAAAATFVGGTIRIMALVSKQAWNGLKLLGTLLDTLAGGALERFGKKMRDAVLFKWELLKETVGRWASAGIDAASSFVKNLRDRIVKSRIGQAIGRFFSGVADRIGGLFAQKMGERIAADEAGGLIGTLRSKLPARFRGLGTMAGRAFGVAFVAAAILFIPEVRNLFKEALKIIPGFEEETTHSNNEEIASQFGQFLGDTNLDYRFTGKKGNILKILDAEGKNDFLFAIDKSKDLAENLENMKKSFTRWRSEINQGETGKEARRVERLRQEIKDLKKAQDDSTDSTKRQGRAARKAKEEGLDPLRNALYGTGKQSENLGEGLKGITNKILNKFGAEELVFDVPKIIKRVSGFFQSGGFFGQRGMRGPDDRLIGVAGGEAILTGHHQAVTDTAMGFANAAGVIPFASLNEMFNRDRRPHASAPGYQRGGRVPRPPNIVGLGNWLMSKGYAVGEHPRFGGIQGDHGNYGPSDHYHGGAIDVNADNWPGGEFAAINKIAGRLAAAGWHVLWQVADHYDHLHADIGAAAAQIGSTAGGGLGGIPRIPKFNIRGKNSAQKNLLQAQADKLRKSANEMFKNKFSHGTPGPGVGGFGGAGSLSRNAMQRILNRAGLPDIFYWIAGAESNWNPGTVNSIGATGLFQVLKSAHPDLAARFNLLNPLQNALASKILYMNRIAAGSDPLADWYASKNEGGLPFGNGGWGQKLGDPSFNDGGIVPGPIGMPRRIIAHGGETVLPTHQRGGITGPFAARSSITDASQALGNVEIKRFKKLDWKKIMKLLNNLVGAFRALSEDITNFVERSSVNLTLATYRLRGGILKKVLKDTQIMKKNIKVLEKAANSYRAEIQQIGIAENDLEKELKKLKKQSKGLKGKEKKQNKKAQQKVDAALNDLAAQKEEIKSNLAATYEEMFQAQGQLIRERVSKFDAKLGRSQQRGTLVELDEQLAGGDINVGARLNNLKDQRGILLSQRGAIEKALSDAQALGDTALVDELKGALLDNSIALKENTLSQREVFREKFEQTLTKFAEKLASSGLNQRIAELSAQISGNFNVGIGLAGISNNQSILGQERSAIEQQLREARARGDDPVLIRQMEDALKENTIAQLENTLAIREVWKEHFERLMNAVATRLTRIDLRNRIAEVQAAIQDKPLTQAVMAQFNAERRQALLDERGILEDALKKAIQLGDVDEAERLRTALLENELALLENTKELKELNGQFNVQNFSSTAWKLFRRAIFTGTGQIIPQLQGSIPSLHSGGMVTRDGLVNLQAGEVVKPRSAASGDQNFYFTQPMEQADPLAIASNIAWALKTQKVTS